LNGPAVSLFKPESGDYLEVLLHGSFVKSSWSAGLKGLSLHQIISEMASVLNFADVGESELVNWESDTLLSGLLKLPIPIFAPTDSTFSELFRQIPLIRTGSVFTVKNQDQIDGFGFSNRFVDGEDVVFFTLEAKGRTEDITLSTLKSISIKALKFRKNPQVASRSFKWHVALVLVDALAKTKNEKRVDLTGKVEGREKEEKSTDIHEASEKDVEEASERKLEEVKEEAKANVKKEAVKNERNRRTSEEANKRIKDISKEAEEEDCEDDGVDDKKPVPWPENVVVYRVSKLPDIEGKFQLSLHHSTRDEKAKENPLVVIVFPINDLAEPRVNEKEVVKNKAQVASEESRPSSKRLKKRKNNKVLK
jgi:hypothetical protein